LSQRDKNKDRPGLQKSKKSHCYNTSQFKVNVKVTTDCISCHLILSATCIVVFTRLIFRARKRFWNFTAEISTEKVSLFRIAVIQVQSKPRINTVTNRLLYWIDDLFALLVFDFFSRGYPSTKLWEIWLVGQIDPYFFVSLARSILIFLSRWDTSILIFVSWDKSILIFDPKKTQKYKSLNKQEIQTIVFLLLYQFKSLTWIRLRQYEKRGTPAVDIFCSKSHWKHH
jgi:hypothetical protein